MNNKKGFIGLVAAQALGALNDNAFKLVVSLLAVDLLVKDTGGTEYVSMVGAVFIMPFLLLTTFGGYLADRFSKRGVIIYSKIAELLIMVLCFFALVSGNTVWIYSVLFLMGAHSALSSPAKYGIMPEMFGEDEISEANGAMHLWTYVSIIIGTAFGGYIFYLLKDRIYQTSYIFMLIALAGLVASFFVAKVKPQGTKRKIEINIIKEIVQSMRIARQDNGVFLSILGLTYFGLIGGLFQLNILLYARKIMEIDQMRTGMLLTVAGAGMAAGSYLAGRLSGHKVEYGLVPLGGFGLSASLILLGFTYGSIGWTSAMLFMMGVSSGFFVVPLNALIQIRVAEERRGQMIAALNFLSFSGILLSSGILYLFRELLGLNSAMIFLVTGVCSIAATLYIFKVMPEAFVRLMNWLLAHSIYRITLKGEENIPGEGGALLVCNHVSYADPILVMSSIKRPVRFMVFRPIYENPVINPFCKITGAIPVSFADRPKSMIKSLQTAKEAVRNGEVVCIFAEGGLTRTGNLLPFNKGFEYIMKDLDAPIIPMNIDRIWGSVFSYKDGKYFRKIPRRWPYPITVSFAPGMPASSTVHEVRTRVEELAAEAMRTREEFYKKLHIAFIDEVKRHPFRFLMADSMGVKFNCVGFLAAAAALSGSLFRERSKNRGKGEMVGVLLPSSCIGALVNTAVLLAGKVPVNLNFTSSKESIEYAVKECAMDKIITSRKFLQKVNIEENDKMVFAEDIKDKVSKSSVVWNMVLAFLLPSFALKAIFVSGGKDNVDDTATIIFSSGSTGTPKGVMLSHRNLISNIGGIYQVLNVGKNDVIMGVLPFFHSFGFSCTLCLPLGVGIGVVYHSNPLDARTIGEMAKKYKATMIMGTPTFLSAYTKKCLKEQFASLKYAVVGAEKLTRAIAEAFHEKFGVIPLEGYGATELSPVVSLCIPDYINEKERVKQVGYKEGKVGHPIPNVAVKTVDPDTYRELPANAEGMLLVKGANVMKGYLNREDKTREVIRDGWYITGDIASIDDDGFICITDRLSRFSKIGGEMVPHVKIEETINELIAGDDRAAVVTAVPDEKKGEKLVVLYTGDVDTEDLSAKLAAKGLPNLWLPKKDNFHKIDVIPYLGSGKLDLKKVKEKAAEIDRVKS